MIFVLPLVLGVSVAALAQSANTPAVAAADSSFKLVNLMNEPIALDQELISDIYFQESLAAFDRKNNSEAALHMRIGAQELIKETPRDKRGSAKKLIEQRVGELFVLSFQLEAGLVRERSVLQKHFANAGESVALRYYEIANALPPAAPPSVLADRLTGMSNQLRQSKEYRADATEKKQIAALSEDAAGLAADLRDAKPTDTELLAALKLRLNKLMSDMAKFDK